MKRVILAMVWLACASAGWADGNPVEQRLIASLTAQGYVILEDGYTWLGRLRIVAENGSLHREVVVNPGTGEVLRDYAQLITDMVPPAANVAVASDSEHTSHPASPAVGAAALDEGAAAVQGSPDDLLLPPAMGN